MRTHLWYEFRRANIEIPYPIQIEYSREEQPLRTDAHVEAAAAQLRRIDLFSTLAPDATPPAGARDAADHLFAAGEAIVRQGDAGSSMFVVLRGTVAWCWSHRDSRWPTITRRRVLRRDVDADRRSAHRHCARGR